LIIYDYADFLKVASATTQYCIGSFTVNFPGNFLVLIFLNLVPRSYALIPIGKINKIHLLKPTIPYKIEGKPSP
jgi:hypothetical protein